MKCEDAARRRAGEPSEPADDPIAALGTYADLAGEYYDAARHPTCAAFRAASQRIVAKWLPREARSLCEIGAGRSMAAELGFAPDRLMLVDSSREMLAHSAPWIASGARGVVACAESLPFPDASLDAVVCSLADPFDRPSFWCELARVARVGASAIFTTPSWEWAMSYRSGADFAEFTTRDGRTVRVSSYVLPPEFQVRMMARAGFTTTATEVIRIADLPEERRAPKLMPEQGLQRVIVAGFLLRRLDPRGHDPIA